MIQKMPAHAGGWPACWLPVAKPRIGLPARAITARGAVGAGQAAATLGRRTARTLPLVPPPQ
jgi:hypothetical protein